MNEFRAETIEDIAEALDHPLLFERSTEDRREIARTLATKLFMSGWVPPISRTQEPEEWRVIPGFSAWQISNKGFIRHSISRVWVPISAIGEQIQPVTLYDDTGRDIELDYQHILDVTWPKEGTEILFDSGSTAYIPDAEFTGKVTKVEVREEEWRDIECIVGLNSFEIERGGTIRHKKTKRVQEATYDEERGVMVVELILNGKPIKLIGEYLVDAMWDSEP